MEKNTGKKRHMLLKVILGCLAVLLVAGVGFYFWSRANTQDWGGMERPVDPNGALTSITIIEAGDMLGCYYSWEAKLDGDTCLVTVVQQPTHSDREKTSKKRVDVAYMEELLTQVENGGFTECASWPPTEYYTLDAATTSVRFTLCGEEYRFSEDKDIPQEANDALRTIIASIETTAGVRK